MLLKSILMAMAVATSIALPAVADDAQESVTASLVAFNDRFNELAANHDAEGLIALYDRDAFWIAPNERPAQGRDGVPRQTITFMSENKGALTHTIEDLFISGDGTQAVMKGVTTASVAEAGFELEGTYVYVLERADKNAPWRIVLDMYNDYGDG